MNNEDKFKVADRLADYVDLAFTQLGISAHAMGGTIHTDAVWVRVHPAPTDADMMDAAYTISRSLGGVRVVAAEDKDGKFYSVKTE